MVDKPIHTESDQPTIAAVAGDNKAPTDQGFAMGIHGTSDKGEGVRGETNAPNHAAVAGFNNATSGIAWGVFGLSQMGEGVHGDTNSPTFAAVVGFSSNPNGTGAGVFGENRGKGAGVAGVNNQAQGGPGIFGHSESREGVFANSNSLDTAAVAGIADNPNGTGAGIFGESRGKGPAGFFKGNVVVTGDILLTNAADCAEDFDIAGLEHVEPGTVMVLDQQGALQPSQQAYDKKVVGVISGAGHYKPGLVLDKQQSPNNRSPIALMGKVYCKVDAQYSPIEMGDLITTSPTPGYAMKADDPLRAFGAVIGKALRTLSEGQGLIPILIALQ